jgi:hypothetical protein
LGISENLIQQWKPAARANQSPAELEIERLRRRLRKVEMERDILKKALSMCIDSYYNRVRWRTALGYQNPEDFERVRYQRTEARENFGQRPGKDTTARHHSCRLK